MKIKNLFDDLKQLGKKKYYFKNGEEEIYFSRKDLEIEIVNINNNIDLIINHNGLRNNYINSNSIPENCKKEIKLILNSYLTTDVKCKKISQILIKIFNFFSISIINDLSISVNLSAKGLNSYSE